MISGSYYILVFSFFLFTVFLFLLIYGFKKKGEVFELSRELESLNFRFSSVRDELEKLRSENHLLASELEESKKLVLDLTADKRSLESRLEEKEKSVKELQDLLERERSEIKNLSQAILRDKEEISELRTALELEKEASEERFKLLNEAKERLSQEFQNLANKIFEDKSRKFNEQSRFNLENILNPLNERIQEFSKKVTETYEREGRERFSLVKQIEELKNLNIRISQEADNLVRALKGDTKTQGIWGEMVLEKVLEMSGLRKGVEYKVQNSFRSEDGRLLRPDAIVELPEGKQVVIDSKVSLTAYERYVREEDEELKKAALREHLTSFHNHINVLSERCYEKIPEIRSLNYVLMFVPIESAYMLAIENDKELMKKAFDKDVMIVSPSTLLITLRTIQCMWQFEYQNRNAQIIAEKAGRLYDKFVDFVKHLRVVGQRLDQAKDSYDDAFKALQSGRGSLIKRVQELKPLGIKSKKSLPKDIVFEDGDPSDEEVRCITDEI